MPTQQFPLIPTYITGPGHNIQNTGSFNMNTCGIFNGYLDIIQESISNTEKTIVTKRPHLFAANLSTNFTDSSQYIDGLVNSLDTKSIIYVLTGTGGPLARITNLTSGVTTNQALPAGWSNTLSTRFCKTDGSFYGSGVFYLATEGLKGAVIDSAGVWTEITDADFTGLGTKTNFVALDGYAFIGIISGAGAGRLYNSDLNNSKSWTSTSYLSVSDYPGTLVWLSRIRNYVVVFKQYSLEFYENVGNPTPGSPLEPQRQLNRRIGCLAASSIQEVSDGIIFLGINEKGRPGVYKIFRDSLEIKEISNDAIRSGLNTNVGLFSFFPTYNSGANQTSSLNILGCSQIINWRNKEFYSIVITTPDAGDVNIDTWTYDNINGYWYIWESYILADNQIFNPSQCTFITAEILGYKGPIFVGRPGTLDPTPSEFWLFSDEVNPLSNVADYETEYPFYFQTGLLDFNSSKPKFLDSVFIHYALSPTLASYSGNFNLYYVDNNFSSTSVGPKVIPYSTSVLPRARASRLGRFYKRSFSFGTRDANPIQISGLEFNFNIGEDE